MRRIFYILAATVLFSSCIRDHVKGEGDIASDTRSVASFHTVRSDGSNRVSVVPDSVYKVVITGYENLVPLFNTKVSNGRLYLGYDDDQDVSNDNIQVEVHAPSVESVQLEGSGIIRVNAGFTGPRLGASIDGSGRVELMGGVFRVISADIDGSGEVLCRPAICDTAYADISGSGDIELSVNQYLDAEISGSGNIRYWGNPLVRTHISGSGNITKY